MEIGVPREIKNHEYRVGLTPSGVSTLVRAGHRVFIESNAGRAIDFSNDLYIEAGAEIAQSVERIFQCDMVVKVKEPQAQEITLLHRGQILFTYLHLAADRQLVDGLLQTGVIAIAYETVRDAAGRLPLLTPMSEVAGRLAIQAGATCLQMANGGRGVMLGGVPGVTPAKVLVVGGGVVGTQAARMALGLGADVTLLDNNIERLRYLDDVYGPALKTRFSDASTIAELSREADLLIGAVLLTGKQAPKLITREHIGNMKPGSVLVDVAIDQGGCAETSKPTTHQDPTYVVDGVIHYCVANMPGACARTATMALTNATLPYVMAIASKGYRQALLDDEGLKAGLSMHLGVLTCADVAQDLQLSYQMADVVFGDVDNDIAALAV
jgi:alanine dehydrogenase